MPVRAVRATPGARFVGRAEIRRGRVFRSGVAGGLRWAAMRNTTRLLTSCLVVVLVALGLAACDGDDAPSLRIGSSDDPAMRAAAAVYAVGLTRSGTPATVQGAPTGSDARLLEAVAAGEADLFPAFTGALLTRLTARPEAMAGEELLAEVARSLPQGVAVGDPTGVSNRPQLLVSAELRERHDVETLQQCAALPAGLPLVVAPGVPDDQLAAFAACRPGPVERVPQVQALLDRVLSGGALGVAPALVTASAGEVHGVVALKSDAAPRAQDLVPVYRSAALGRSQLKALSRIAGELTTGELAGLAARVAEGADPRVVASEWYATRGS
ncbi:glycine betaine ABC transporter substrate-binding protein [Gordonia sp. (in: high G+C Gram-positive bacteria)]|uniref:glycine betaine ABC transporter substrate-binding protein n=1 Tax=Gordonia sp. (in: high G+C Gram-positive bacteria) TaxID=84139 RepID=UPI0039E6E6CB